MARFNEILSGRFNRALQKLTSIKGEAPAPVLGSEILPVFPMFFGNENRYLESWQTFGTALVQGASVGNISAAHIRNPVGSNVIAVVTKLMVSNQQAVGGTQETIVVEGPNPSTAADDLATLGTSICRFDARGQQNPTLVLSRGNPATDTWPGNTRGWVVLFAQASSVYEVIVTDIQEFVLLPGDGFRVADLSVNTQLAVSCVWRERFLEESERT